LSDKSRNTTLYVRPQESTVHIDPFACAEASGDVVEMLIVQGPML
jgi:hypothetical protein